MQTILKDNILCFSMVSHVFREIMHQREHICHSLSTQTLLHSYTPPLHLLSLCVTNRKVSIFSNCGHVRSTNFKEGRKKPITPLGVFHALAVISTAHFLTTHVCTIYGEKQVRLAVVNQTFQFKSLWEEFQLRTHCGNFLWG